MKTNTSIYFLLTLVSLGISSAFAQLNIKVTDPNGNGISHVRLISKLNLLHMETDDSGFLNLDKTIVTDTFEFSRINFKTHYFKLSNSKSTLNIELRPDTFMFSGIAIKGNPCQQITANVTHRYGEDMDKNVRFPFGSPLDFRVRVAQPFELRHNCGTLESIAFYVPRFPNLNKELLKIYNLNIYIVVSDTATNLAKWQLVHVMDLKKLKTGWNKVKPENCRFNSEKLFVGFELSLKSDEDIEKALTLSYSREYAISIASNKSKGQYIWYADFGNNHKGWTIGHGTLVVKIVTKEED